MALIHLIFSGFIFGVWNSHTSLGNILGTTLASRYVEHDWGLSFIIPGLIMAVCGLVIFLFLAPHPSNVGCGRPIHVKVRRNQHLLFNHMNNYFMRFVQSN